jgi:hypothetical protein
MTGTLSPRALNRATLARQMLLRREAMKPAAAVEHLLALQAQLARPPFIALWSRLEGFRREDLVAAIGKREVVRATMMRGTLHLMARKDYLAFRAAIQPLLTSGLRARMGDRLDAIDVDAIVAEARAFFGKEPRTFEALRDHLLARDPKCDERGLGYTVRMHLPLVQVPASAPWGYPPSSDFALAEEYCGKAPGKDAKPHALALRYFAAFGPASVADLQSWTGLQALREVVSELRPKLRAFRDESGRELFDLPDAPRPDEDVEAPVRFLPEFDNVLLGYAERSRVIDDVHRPKVFTKNLRVLPIFLVDGRAAGSWSIDKKKLKIEPFGKLRPAEKKAVEEEGDRLLKFV